MQISAVPMFPVKRCPFPVRILILLLFLPVDDRNIHTYLKALFRSVAFKDSSTLYSQDKTETCSHYPHFFF